MVDTVTPGDKSLENKQGGFRLLKGLYGCQVFPRLPLIHF